MSRVISAHDVGMAGAFDNYALCQTTRLFLCAAVPFSLAGFFKGCALVEHWALVHTISHHNQKHDESETIRAYAKPNSIQPQVWYHAATVYDPFEESLTLYLNGKEVETARGVSVTLFNIRDLRFGTWFKANQAFRGMFDEFNLYNFVRTAEKLTWWHNHRSKSRILTLCSPVT